MNSCCKYSERRFVTNTVSMNSTLLYNLSSTSSSNGTTSPGYNNIIWRKHAIGISLAISGNIMISMALSVQKYSHNRLGENGKYYLDKYWWLGMLMMVVGEFGNFLAYGFAPASLVAPLGSVAVLSNVCIAAIFLREPITPPGLIGVTMIIIGSIFLISFSAAGNYTLPLEMIEHYLKAWTFLVYIGIEAIALVILLYLNLKLKMNNMVILLLIVAILASATVISAKAVSTLLSDSIQHGIERIMNPVFWVMLLILPVTTATQIKYLNMAMQLYNVSDVVPVNFIFFTVSAILAGNVFYQEFYGVPILRVCMFLFGCCLSFIGVYIISQCKSEKSLGCNCLVRKGEDEEPIIDSNTISDQSEINGKLPKEVLSNKRSNNQGIYLVSKIISALNLSTKKQ